MNLSSNPYYYSSTQVGIDRKVKELLVERCLPHVRGPRVLDLGFVDDLWTAPLLHKQCSVDIVEGAGEHVEMARGLYGKNPAVRIFHQLFQGYQPDGVYSTIIAGDMIRYLPDPCAFLKSARSWLKDGRLIITVPNSLSLHRRIGTLMGHEPHPTALNAQDVKVGNLRCYDRYELRYLLLEAGYDIECLHGFFLKPLSSTQMADWSMDLVRAYAEIGDELEDYGWFLYAVATPRAES